MKRSWPARASGSRHRWWLAGVALLLLTPRPALADPATAQGGELYSIEKRRLMGHHELSVGVGTLPMDAFGKGIALQGAYTYHFNHLLGWEIIGGAYSFVLSTGLREDLRTRFDAEPEREGEIKALLNSNVVIKPLYGKLAFLNDSLLAAELAFTAGPTVGLFDDGSRPVGLNAGVGLRLFLGPYFSMRVDLRDYAFVAGLSDIRNHLYLSLGLGLTFGFAANDEEE
ncbi:MAG: outer membrane beta-barrel domain-containing protein [Proteobacteria bacterium]|nr:outer membrane beta-barrel domain-containing protein [Pseudomonadota bacterium]